MMYMYIASLALHSSFVQCCAIMSARVGKFMRYDISGCSTLAHCTYIVWLREKILLISPLVRS